MNNSPNISDLDKLADTLRTYSNKYAWEQTLIDISDENLQTLIKTFPNSAMLNSGNGEYGRYDIVTAYPEAIINADQLQDNQIPPALSTVIHNPPPPPESFVAIPFSLGFIGFASYEFGAQKIIGIDKSSSIHTSNKANTPPIYIGAYSWSYVKDLKNKKAYLSFSPFCPNAKRKKIKEILFSRKTETSAPTSMPHPTWKKTLNEAHYHQQLSKIKRYIHQGDCYQVNYTQRFEAEIAKSPQGYSPIDHYIELKKVTDTPYSCYLSFDADTHLLCFSPEQFIGIRNKFIETKPIKGTIANTGNQGDSHALRQSTKNQAENLMIVDLLRNDLSKVCTLHSVKVDKLFSLESYKNVHHLVSHISGELKPGTSELEAFFSCFPGGSITGAPKKRAMEIINELETSPREAYCGSVFYLNYNGNFDSNILIRSIVQHKDKLFCWAGGGIVADSSSDEEYQESLTKVANLTGIAD